MVKCLQCNTDTTNPKFCSKSCSAKYNNRKYPKRTRRFSCCQSCGVPYTETGKYHQRKYCNECHENRRASVENRPLSLDQANAKYQVSSNVRGRARRVISRASVPSVCAYCGYSKHVEVCHIKPIYSFDGSATLAEINDLSNLILLCPNCHWEFDNGLLDLKKPE